MNVLTANEVAILLKMKVATIYKLAREGKLPSAKLNRGGHVLFIEQDIECYLRGLYHNGEGKPIRSIEQWESTKEVQPTRLKQISGKSTN